VASPAQLSRDPPRREVCIEQQAQSWL
jgi:hypothetical protein